MSGCTSTSKVQEVLAPSRQLRYRVGMFNKYLRWKAFRRAKLLVMPKKRPAFVMKWEKNRPYIRITGFSIRDITETEPGKKAVALIVVHRHRLPSVSVQRVLEQQRWESKKGYWFFVGLVPKNKPAAR